MARVGGGKEEAPTQKMPKKQMGRRKVSSLPECGLKLALNFGFGLHLPRIWL